MAGIKETLSYVLKGEFLTSENSRGSWEVIGVVVLLCFVMIVSSHKAYNKVMDVARLNKEIKALKAEYIDVTTKLTTMRMESTIKTRVEKDSLFPSVNPPVKIKVIAE